MCFATGVAAVGDLTTFKGLGSPEAVASLVVALRDREAASNSNTGISEVVPGSVSLTPSGFLEFAIKTPLTVMRPDLLEEQEGVRELYRVTFAKARMRGDGTFVVMWAGALNTDINAEGSATQATLQDALESFVVNGA